MRSPRKNYNTMNDHIICISAFEPTRKDLNKHLCTARTVSSFCTRALFIVEVGGNVTVVFSLPFIPRLSVIQFP
jgi:hypothetical protein